MAAYASGYVPETQQKRMAHSLMQERMTMPRRADELSDWDDLGVDLSLLDVPPEVAHIFSKIHDWSPPHSDNQVTYTVGSVEPSDRNFTLPHDIDSYVFSKYVDVHFSKEESFSRRVRPLDHPLLPKHNHNTAREALALFKLTMRYMYDPNLSAKQETLLGDYVVQKGLSLPELRDELYCQLLSQTFLHPHHHVAERAWVLVANCLSCFPPTHTLAPYLLKYVSDQAPEHYKAFLQHKTLQCLHHSSPQPRVYPPCLLEWKANRKAALMALEAEFSDSVSVRGHLDSYSTGEHFAAHLLRCRDMTEGTHGWTVALNDDGNLYECAGHEYVMDLLSEVEVPPQFPYTSNPALVQPHSNAHNSRHALVYKNMAHDPLRGRLAEQTVEELRQPVPVHAYNRLPAETLLQHTGRGKSSVQREHWFDTRDELLASTKLNQRKPVGDNSDLSSRSALNVRYREAQRNPSVSGWSDVPRSEHRSSPLNTVTYNTFDTPNQLRVNTDVHRKRSDSSPDNIHSSTSSTPQKNIPPIFTRSVVDEPTHSPIPSAGYNDKDIPFSEDSALNERYIKQPKVDPAAVNPISKNSKLNTRYTRTPTPISNGGATNGYIPNNKRPTSPSRYTKHHAADQQKPRKYSQNSRGGGGGVYPASVQSNTDMDGWLDDVFDPVLDVMSDGYTSDHSRALAGRIKGSGLRSRDSDSDAHAWSTTRSQCDMDTAVNDWSRSILDEVTGSGGDQSEELTSRELASRLKGGGHDSTQTQVAPRVQLPFATSQYFAAPATGSIPIGPLQTVVDPVSPPPAVMQMRDPQQAELQQQLHTKQLETQILEQSVQAEILKKQLHQLQGQPPPRAPTVQSVVVAPPPVAAKPAIQPISQIQPTTQQKAPDHNHHHHQQPAMLSPRQQPEIDETRPGGVKTLTRNFEHKVQPGKPSVTRSHFEAPPPSPVKPQPVVAQLQPVVAQLQPVVAQLQVEDGAEKARKVSAVTFAENVSHIPRPDSPLSSPRSMASSMPSISPPPPPMQPPPPPPPPPAAHRSPSPQPLIVPVPSKPLSEPAVHHVEPARAAVEQDGAPVPMAVSELDKRTIVDRKGVSKRVRIGKVEWPPRMEEAEKVEREVGRLLIDEKKSKKEELIKGTPLVMDKVQIDYVAAEKGIAAILAPKKEPLEVEKIDMQVARAALEAKLGAIRKRSDVTQTEPPVMKMESDTQTDGHFDQNLLVKASASQAFEAVFTSAHTREVQTQTVRVESPLIKHVEGSAFDKYIRPPTPSPIPSHHTSSSGTPVPRSPSPELVPDLSVLAHARTQLYPQLVGPFYTYDKVPWKLQVRKEVFTPREALKDPVLVSLVFAQVVQDVFSDSCMRISMQDKLDMRSKLEHAGISPSTAFSHRHTEQSQQRLIDTALGWPFYFSRLHPVSGGSHNPDVHFAAISHSGLRLLSKDRARTGDRLSVLRDIPYGDIADSCVARPGVVQLSLASGAHLMLYTPRAADLAENVESYCIESAQVPGITVKALKDNVSDDHDVLNLRAGDVITVDDRDRYLPQGWLYGACHGRCGKFPAESVVAFHRQRVQRVSMGSSVHAVQWESRASSVQRASITDQTLVKSGGRDSVDHSSSASTPRMRELDPLNYPLLPYALLNFTQSPFRVHESKLSDNYPAVSQRELDNARKRREGTGEWSAARQFKMVQFSKSRPKATLLKYDAARQSGVALALDHAVMQNMGELAADQGQQEVELVLKIVKEVRAQPHIGDEVYCRLLKQLTDNPDKQSVIAGWRLLQLLAAYYGPSEHLQPHVDDFLDMHTTQRDSLQHLAKECQRNLSITSKFGGRENVPGEEEILSVSRGRSLLKMSVVLAGGSQVVIDVHSATVIEYCLKEVCDRLEIPTGLERDEFTMFFVVETEHRFCPMSKEDYVMDVKTQLTSQGKDFYFLFQRTSWIFPLHLGTNELYVDSVYNQVVHDYLDGYFCVLSGNNPPYLKTDAALLAAYKMKIDKDNGVTSELDKLLPAMLHGADGMNKQKWTRRVNDIYKANHVEGQAESDCKAEFIKILVRWPNFGSTFFNVKKVTGPDVRCEECVLAVSRVGVKFLRTKNHTAIAHYTFEKLLSAKRVQDEKQRVFLHIMHGDLAFKGSQGLTKVQTDKATAVNSLINQYFRIQKEMP